MNPQTLWDKISRNWYAVLAASLLLGWWGDKMIWRAMLTGVGILGFTLFAWNIALHALTKIDWLADKDADGKPLAEFVVLGKYIVIAAVGIVIAIVVSGVFGNFLIHASDTLGNGGAQ